MKSIVDALSRLLQRINLMESASVGAVEAPTTPSVTDFVTAGDAANRERNWPEAERHYRKALELDPSLGAIWVQLGHAVKEQGRYADAEMHYRMAQSFLPDDSDLYLQIGHCKKLQGQLEEASKAYRTALALDKDNLDAPREFLAVESWHRSGEAHEKNGKDAQGNELPDYELRYRDWSRGHDATVGRLALQKREALTSTQSLKFSIIVPVYKVPAEVLEALITCVRGQSYQNWELCLGLAYHGSDELTRVVSLAPQVDDRIKVIIIEQNGGISRNSNAILRHAVGDFVVLLDHDDLISPDALYEMAAAVERETGVDLVYSDKDMITADGERRHSPLFKPEWSPDIMLNANYLTHLNAIRRERLVEIGGWDPETDGAQDWDVFLRVIGRNGRVVHVPRILYHWRTVPTSVAAGGIDVKPYAASSQLVSVSRWLSVQGWAGASPHFVSANAIKVRWSNTSRARVGVVFCSESVGCGLPAWVSAFNCETRLVEGSNLNPSFLNRVISGMDVDVVVLCALGLQPLSDSWLDELTLPLENVSISLTCGKVLGAGNQIIEAGWVVDDFALQPLFRGAQRNGYTLLGSVDWYRNVAAASQIAMAFKISDFTVLGGFRDVPDYDVKFAESLTRMEGRRGMYNPFAEAWITDEDLHASCGAERRVKVNSSSEMVFFNRNLRISDDGSIGYKCPDEALSEISPSSISTANASSPASAAVQKIRFEAGSALYRVLWVVNDSDLQTQKYRVLNYADELSRHNVDSVVVRDAELGSVCAENFDIIVLNRIAASEVTKAFVTRCKTLGRPVRYDIDDLVFCAERLSLLRFTQSLPAAEFNLFREGVIARRELMLMCDAVTTSTYALALEVHKLGLPAYVVPNTIGRADLEQFGNVRPRGGVLGGKRVRIGYFSGTRTHQHDFACCADGLARVLRDNVETELLVVGELELPDCFQDIRNQIIAKPLMPHKEMLLELSTIDINLAPLELNNAFTACKSELKIFEAALFAIPTVASPTATFVATIHHGETGMLAASPDEWSSCISALVRDAELRRKLGAAAKESIVLRYSITTAAAEAKAVDQALISRRAVSLPRPLALSTRADEAPLVTVVAVLYKKRMEVRYFLESLRRQSFHAPYEVLLVDDCSPDDGVRVVEDFLLHMQAAGGDPSLMTVKILRNDTNLGNCASRNRAIKEAKGRIVVVVDADCILNRSFLLEHYRAHQHGDCDVGVGPMNIETNDTSPYAVLGQHEVDPSLRIMRAQLQDDCNKSSFVNCITRNFSVSRRFIKENLGGELFDNQFAYSASPDSGFGWEDVEMGCRLYKAGARIRFLDETFSIHVSHPSSTEEKTKPLRSLKNFRRLHEKHPDLIFLARQWSIRTHDAILGWVAAVGLSCEDNADALFLRRVHVRYQQSPIPINRSRKLRVLTHRWHCPHQYELYRSGHEFTLVTGAGTKMCDNWEWDKRPMPFNARFVPHEKINPLDYDLALIHFDENVIRPEQCNGKVPADWGATLNWFMTEVSLPKIGVCHGTPQFAGQYNVGYSKPDLGMVDDAARAQLVDYLRDVLIVCNSHQAKQEWGFERSTVIWHGFAPHDYPEGARSGGVLTMLGAALENRPHYNGLFVVRRIQQLVSNRVDISALVVKEPSQTYSRDTQEWAESKFRTYARTVGSYSVYLNPTLRSPMPRSRGEAMMLGLATVSMRNHDVDLFVRNGVNGFFAESAEEMAEQLEFLTQNAVARSKMAVASRRTALDLFNQDRYLSDWSRIFLEVAG